MRDPAPIINFVTFWDFMKGIEAAASLLEDAEKASPLYLEHVACYDRVYQARTDTFPVGDQVQLGEYFIEALAAYADQAADLLPLLLEHGDDPAQGASLLQEFEGVLATVVEEIHEVPGGPAVQLALAAFEQCPEREQAESLYDQALDLFDQHQYEACLVLLDQAIHLDRGNANLYYARGNTRYALSDLRGAAADYLWALRRAPYYVSAFNNLGNTYEVLGQNEKSIAQYQHALQIEPENATLHYNLGGVYHTVGRLPEALAALNTAIELDPTNADCYLNRANTLSRLGRHEEALADYRQAARLAPEDSNNTWTACWAQFGHEGLTEAQVVELERIAGLDPTHYTSHCCLAVLALQHSDAQAALLHLEQSVALAPKDWDPHFWIGLIAAMTGEPEVARQAIERSLELGLPPLLLVPLSWLQVAHADFFEMYGRDLLQRFGVNTLE
jgi:tetratricopeptide (TPR) repeat protein